MNYISLPFAYLIDKCFILTGNFGVAIILFTFLTRIILFPLSLMSQKNAIKLLILQPLLSDIKARNSGELDALLKEQKALYKKEKYSPFMAILPLLIQIPIIIGVVGAVRSAAADGVYNFVLFWFDLSAVPMSEPSLAFIPLLSAISALILCIVQNNFNPLTKTQGFFGRWGTAIFLTLFSGYFALVTQACVGLYWICGNIFGTLVTVICVMIYSPKAYANYIQNDIKPKLTKEEKQAAKAQKIAEKTREKEDMKRFFSCKKQLVFYSEASGFYKYFQHEIDYILENSNITIHYLTSDFNDRVFKLKRDRFKTYFCGSAGLITVFMKFDADIVVTTLPDLEKYQYKRSLVRKDIEYIYMCHGLAGYNLTLRKGAIDHYDTVFCYGKSNSEEIRAIEKAYGLPPKNLVNTGFSLLDIFIGRYEALEKTKNEKPQILIAPSWQKDNIFEYCFDELMTGLGSGYKIIIRPHPEFVKRFPVKMKQIFDKCADRIGEDFEIQTDFSSNSTVFLSDLVITDWSSIAQEFSFATKRPSLFINTPMKIMNPEWQKINISPIDIWIRDIIGVSVNINNLIKIDEEIHNLLTSGDAYSQKINEFLSDHMYNMGNAAKTGGDYIINRLKTKGKL